MTLGILAMDTRFQRIPGDIGNAETFGFETSVRRIDGATPERVIMQRDLTLLEPYIAGADELARADVQAITTTCGFLALFQRELAAAVDVPVFTSSLLLVPLVSRMLRPNQQVGILTGDSRALDEAHFNAVSWSSSDVPVAVQGLEMWPAFHSVYTDGGVDLDPAAAGQAMTEAAVRLATDHPAVGAVVLECANMAPYAHLVQASTGLPVFDVQLLANLVHEATSRVPYVGM